MAEDILAGKRLSGEKSAGKRPVTVSKHNGIPETVDLECMEYRTKNANFLTYNWQPWWNGSARFDPDLPSPAPPEPGQPPRFLTSNLKMYDKMHSTQIWRIHWKLLIEYWILYLDFFNLKHISEIWTFAIFSFIYTYNLWTYSNLWTMIFHMKQRQKSNQKHCNFDW